MFADDADKDEDDHLSTKAGDCGKWKWNGKE
jgi:hypothetical protein